MSTYHLHARLLKGPLAAPERDEARVWETDSWDDAQAWAREQLFHGFTVWIYDHGHAHTDRWSLRLPRDRTLTTDPNREHTSHLATTAPPTPTDPPHPEPAGLLIPGGSSEVPPTLLGPPGIQPGTPGRPGPTDDSEPDASAAPQPSAGSPGCGAAVVDNAVDELGLGLEVLLNTDPTSALPRGQQDRRGRRCDDLRRRARRSGPAVRVRGVHRGERRPR